MALTPLTTPYLTTVQTALQGAIARNATTPLGRVLTINPSLIASSVTQDGTPYTCKRHPN